MSEPIPNLFPALEGPVEAALRESIQRFGVLVPVVRDQHGRTLDGHHRSRIADDLGVKYRVDVVSVEDDDQARAIATTLNTDRRQLDAEQRREIVAALREQGHSLRAIAGAVGASLGTVQRDVGATGVSPDTPGVVGQDGKRYPARRPTVVAAKNEREAEKAQAALSDVSLPNVPVLDVKRVERIAREQQAEKRRAAPVTDSTSAECEIRHGDFRNVLAGRDDLAGAVVISDPPYPREFLPLYRDLAELALARDWRSLVLMIGQSILPDVLDSVRDAGWVYRWTGAYLTVGPATRVWGGNVGTSWKPILVFDRGEDREFATLDLFRSSGDDKRHHYWGQNEDGFLQIVEAFTSAGDTVIDPFLGGGTTALACRELGRRFIGCDVDSAAIQTTQDRLAA